MSVDLVVLGGAILVASLLSWLYIRLRGVSGRSPGALGTIRDEKTKIAPRPGSSLPDPDPLTDFDLENTTSRNFVYANKTVRHPYYQTMAHQPMHANHWIEIDKEYKWYIDEKARVIKEQGKVVIDSLPDNDEACGELLMELLDYLPKRYPTLFTREGYDTITNHVFSERHEGLSRKRGIEALHVIARLVQDDFLMGREREDGQIYLVGGLIGFPGFYLLSETIGKPIRVLHAPVPYFNEKLLVSVERTLKRFQPDQPFERSSWMITDDRNLFWHNVASAPANPEIHPKDFWLRIDHQTFRKLPRTNAIIFGVHPILRKIEDFADSPLVPALLEKVHLESDPVMLKYKGTQKYDALLLPYLRELTQSQLDRGLITNEDDVRSFRELLKDKNMDVPLKQSTLAVPTESEVRVAMRAARVEKEGVEV
ncbi:hypothetical protein L227DRAFT_594590 [Lentinus tigrinus ALCF2SS1-6]|uniref:Uncharacterized protein n=1 Tax=Lentinus tigrinus ALCF2SS1-6 TaxID=1328759 RepID=A0A5C2S2Q0_9APHY|nr:hypothetical protein L227DRAFT_594590 [Lentinus tigrinus ALCF2SS1-6]